MIDFNRLKNVAKKMGITVGKAKNKKEAGLYHTNKDGDNIKFNGLELLQIQKEKDK